MTFVLSILSLLGLLVAALVCLTVLVVAHELGHFLLAKLNGVWVEEFGIGLPPRVWSKKIGDTVYSLNAIPLGGFVKLHGETSSDEVYVPERAFVKKNVFAKTSIIVAGIVANFLFGIVLFSIIYSFLPDQKIEPLGHVQVIDVVPNSPAQTVGILVGDVIKEINDIPTPNIDDVQRIVSENTGKKVKVEVEREENDTKQIKTFTANLDPSVNDGKLGVAMTDVKITDYFPPWHERPVLAIKKGLSSTVFLVKQVFIGFGGVANEAKAGRVSNELSGPVKLIAFIMERFRYGLLEILNLTAVISINLAVFNILPIPPLDGSRLLTIWLEKIFGKKMSPKIENYINIAGVILLFGLVIFITFREIPQLISAGSLTKFVEQSMQPQ